MKTTQYAAIGICWMLVAAMAAGAAIEPLPVGATAGDYVGQDVMIPMRDGKKLHAEVWRPKSGSENLPILLQRSPYGFALEDVRRSFEVQYKELAAEKFIFVLEDIRGRFGSEGDFVMLRPVATQAGGVDESSDTYDTIDWLLKQVARNNGKVGVFGISYLGWTTALAAINPHPALKALSVQASPEDMYIGDDFHHNGALRLSYAWEYAAALETDGRTLNAFDFDKGDPYAWYLRQYHLADLDQRSLGRTLPSWQNFVKHPNYDEFWQSTVTSRLMPAPVALPNLIVAGWWDQEDFYGPMTIYARQRAQDPKNLNHLVVGPWNHGGWARGESDHYGPYPFGSDTGAYFRGGIETPWFRYWLKGQGDTSAAPATVFETGSNEWHRFDAWPPKSGIEKRRLYLHAAKGLSFATPARGPDDASQGFVSDPAKPVPYRPLPIPPTMVEDSSWSTWLADDQAAFAHRPDVLVFRTEPLKTDVTLRGEVLADLFASTTGQDADWIVKLIDVYPTDVGTPQALRGRELMIANDVFRGRFHSSFEHPEALTPNEVVNYKIDLHSASHVFKAGHRIAVQVQSTWFPLIDRNPQTFLPSIFEADQAAYKAQTHRVYFSSRYPSAIVVDIATVEPPR